jgi:hypothetical protein
MKSKSHEPKIMNKLKTRHDSGIFDDPMEIDEQVPPPHERIHNIKIEEDAFHGLD